MPYFIEWTVMHHKIEKNCKEGWQQPQQPSKYSYRCMLVLACSAAHTITRHQAAI
jgi:hypothetical protein